MLPNCDLVLEIDESWRFYTGIWCRPQWGAWLCRVCKGAGKILFLLKKNNSDKKCAIVKGLAMFTMKNVERERKLRFLFDIYDIDGDGFICNSELYKVRWWSLWRFFNNCTRWGDDDYDLWNFYIQVLKMMVGSNLKEDQLQQIVDKTILQVRTSDHSYLKWQ